MRTPLQLVLARLRQQLTPRRRRHDAVFHEPQPPAPPVEEPFDQQAEACEPVAFAATPGTILPLDGAGTTSTREAMRRQETEELFAELNTTAEKFARAHRRSLGLDQRGEQVAHLIATISRCVFGEHWDFGASIQSALGLDPHATSAGFCELVDQAHVLRNRLRQSGRLEVDQAVRPGSQLDPVRQVPWKSSLPDAPIRFVVFPGLSSRGHVVVKQQVYTISLREAREHGRVG